MEKKNEMARIERIIRNGSYREEDIAYLLDVYQRLEEENRTLREENLTDPLTGAYNRRALGQNFHSSYKITRRLECHPQSIVLVMADVDGFKSINDNMGHSIGDKVLKATVNSFKKSTRTGLDFVHRYAGDEFVNYLSASDKRGSESMFERFYRAFGTELPEDAKETTISFGSSLVPLKKLLDDGIDKMEPDEIQDYIVRIIETHLNEADEDMYINKNGRKAAIPSRTSR